MALGTSVILTYDKFYGSYEKPYLFDFTKVCPWFPLKSSDELAGLVADLMGDGHLQGKPKWRLDFSSNSVDSLNSFGKAVFNLFGVEGKIRPCTTNGYGVMNFGVNSKPLARLLFLIGVPIGSKVDSEYLIPGWIMANPKLFRAFISHYYGCEGCVDLTGNIEIALYKNIQILENGFDFMNQIRFGLENYFGIITTSPFIEKKLSMRKNKLPSRGIRLKIRRRQSILRFLRLVGINNAEKMNKLKRLAVALAQVNR